MTFRHSHGMHTRQCCIWRTPSYCLNSAYNERDKARYLEDGAVV